LEYASGGRVVGSSNLLTPTRSCQQCADGFFSFSPPHPTYIRSYSLKFRVSGFFTAYAEF
ncbi:hypothetical protein, partial [Paramuribaculum intestinale]|uniref:hypothetical protein n=1 Tax=Paramuribaculum intestinale TaxID=2094151 RepID=UPI0026EB4143